jgi:hypothetical protein
MEGRPNSQQSRKQKKNYEGLPPNKNALKIN